MPQGTLVYFTVQDVPAQLSKDVYIVLKGDGKFIEMKMQKINQQFTCNIFIKHQVSYQYKYKIYDKNQYIAQEKSFRNLIYQKYLQNDIWNRKEVTLRIQTTQKAIMKTMKIIVNQRQQNLKIIQKFDLELKQVTYNDQMYYEGIILADSAMSFLEFEFIFNAYIFETNRNEQKYIKKKICCYSELTTIGNQSFVEIQDEEFEQLRCKEGQNNPQQEKKIQNPKFEFLDDSLKNLLKIYEARESRKKDQQIKQLKLERLEQDEIIFYNYQDVFQQDAYSEYQKQFNQIVEDCKIQKSSFLIQFNNPQEEKNQSLQQYQEMISNKEKTIQTLLEKVKQLKKSNEENTQKIQILENKISTYKEQLKKISKAIQELEELLNKEKEQNKTITQEKEKFQQQIFVLDNEIKEHQKTKEILKEQNQITSEENVKIKEENNKINLENQAISTELVFKLNEIDKLLQDKNKYSIFSKFRHLQIRDTKYFLKQYTTSLEKQANLMKESKNILVKMNLKYIEDLKSIIEPHKELYIQADIHNLKYQLVQIELGLKNFLEDKITLGQTYNHFQSQVHSKFEYLCNSNSIKEKERSQIKDIQNCVNQIFEVLNKLDQIKETMPKLQTSQIQLQHQPTDIFYENFTSDQKLKKLHTLR